MPDTPYFFKNPSWWVYVPTEDGLCDIALTEEGKANPEALASFMQMMGEKDMDTDSDPEGSYLRKKKKSSHFKSPKNLMLRIREIARAERDFFQNRREALMTEGELELLKRIEKDSTLKEYIADGKRCCEEHIKAMAKAKKRIYANQGWILDEERNLPDDVKSLIGFHVERPLFQKRERQHMLEFMDMKEMLPGILETQKNLKLRMERVEAIGDDDMYTDPLLQRLQENLEKAQEDEKIARYWIKRGVEILQKKTILSDGLLELLGLEKLEALMNEEEATKA